MALRASVSPKAHAIISRTRPSVSLPNCVASTSAASRAPFCPSAHAATRRTAGDSSFWSTRINAGMLLSESMRPAATTAASRTLASPSRNSVTSGASARPLSMRPSAHAEFARTPAVASRNVAMSGSIALAGPTSPKPNDATSRNAASGAPSRVISALAIVSFFLSPPSSRTLSSRTHASSDASAASRRSMSAVASFESFMSRPRKDATANSGVDGASFQSPQP